MAAGVLAVVAPLLNSCSYSYDILAVARQGRVAFVVDPRSDHQPACVRRIELSFDDPPPIEASSNARSGASDVVWTDSVDYDDACANHFPLLYGQQLRGRHRPEDHRIAARSLQFERIYEILTTTGATGYGGGRFVVHRNGRIENLPRY
jgi:hypothetical protein